MVAGSPGLLVSQSLSEPELLLDASRLIWRASTGRLPTGIDRVCLAYIDHYRHQARAVVQYGALRHILSPIHSSRLFALLLGGGDRFKQEAAQLVFAALGSPKGGGNGKRSIYLNIGHTGLDRPGLDVWIARSGVRPIYLLHDLIPVTHPEYCRAGEREKHERRLDLMLKTGIGLICNSAATRDAVADYATARRVSLPPSRIAWLGATPLTGKGDLDPPTFPYFVMLGTIEGRKNHLLILQIWAEMIRDVGPSAPRLLIIGQRGWECEQVTAMLDRSRTLRGHVTELPRCSDAALAAHLRHARALLFPSFVEGFGMPLVEALGHGTPVIASDIAVFRELAAQVADYVLPTDGVGWRTAIEAYAQPSSRRRAAQLARLAGYHPPTWAAHFENVDNWLASLV